MKDIELKYNMWRHDREDLKGISGNLLACNNEDAREDFLASFGYKDGSDIIVEEMYDLERQYNKNKFIVDSFVSSGNFDLEYFKRSGEAIYIPNNLSLANLFIEKHKPKTISGKTFTTADFVKISEKYNNSGLCLRWEDYEDGESGFVIMKITYFTIVNPPIIEFTRNYKTLEFDINNKIRNQIWEIMRTSISGIEYNNRIKLLKASYDDELKPLFDTILNQFN